MNIEIRYFSGTGNSEAVAAAYRNALTQKGHQVSLAAIEEKTPLGRHDLLLIGGPIYAGNFPDALLQWVRKHVARRGTPGAAVVFSTTAGLDNANGVRSVAAKLGKRGYSIVDTPTFEMPRNFYIDKYAPTPEDVQRDQFQKAGERLALSLDRIDAGLPLKIQGNVLFLDFLADLFRIMAKGMGRSFSIDETCIGCGTCERRCPTGNIRFQEKQYGSRCMMCTRCIHNCPVNAISYKGKKIEPYRVHYPILP